MGVVMQFLVSGFEDRPSLLTNSPHCYTGFCKLDVSCKMQMQSSLVSYSNNRGFGTMLISFILSVVFLFAFATDNQLAKHCIISLLRKVVTSMVVTELVYSV